MGFLLGAQSSPSQPLLVWFNVNSPEAEARACSLTLLSVNCTAVRDPNVTLQRLAARCSTSTACPSLGTALQNAVLHSMLDLDLKNKFAPRNPFQCPQQEHVKFCLKWGFKYQSGVTEQPGGAIAAKKLRGGPEAASYLNSSVKQPSSAH